MLSFSVFSQRTRPGTLLEPRNTPITLDWQNRSVMALVVMKPCGKILQITSKTLLAPCRFDGGGKRQLHFFPIKVPIKGKLPKCGSRTYPELGLHSSLHVPSLSVKEAFIGEETTSSFWQYIKKSGDTFFKNLDRRVAGQFWIKFLAQIRVEKYPVEMHALNLFFLYKS